MLPFRWFWQGAGFRGGAASGSPQANRNLRRPCGGRRSAGRSPAAAPPPSASPRCPHLAFSTAIIHHFPPSRQPPTRYFLDKITKPAPPIMTHSQKVRWEEILSFTSLCSGVTIKLAAGIVSDSKIYIPIPPTTPLDGRRGRTKGGSTTRALSVRQCGDLP